MPTPASLPPGLPVAGIALAVGLAVLLLGYALMPAGGDARRLRRRIEEARRAAVRAPARHGPSAPTSVRRGQEAGWLGPLGRSLLALVPRAGTLRDRLDRAGLAVGVPELVTGCALGGLAVLLALELVWHLPLAIAACCGILAATGLPHLVISGRIARRRRQFVSTLPDAVDLIVRGIKSGLPVAEALNAIGQELPDPVGATFRDVTGNLRLGMTLDEALWAAARRLGVQEFKFFVISLSIQQETGGNLAEILQNLGQMVRRREQVKLKIKAMSSEARASAMIIGSLPFIMSIVIYVINPGYIMQLVEDPRGWLLIGAGLTSMTMGLAVIARMVRFEI
ncbi:MAG: type II secretion system F family protein [Geminicoccaceae bacterium]